MSAEENEFDQLARRGISYEEAINQFYPWAYSSFIALLERTTQRATVSRVLDIGCGDGWTASVLAGLVPDANYLGVDPAPSVIARFHQRNFGTDRFRAVVGDSRSIRSDGGWAGVIENLGAQPDILICHASIHEITKADDAVPFLKFLQRASEGGTKILVGDYYYPSYLTDQEVEEARRWISDQTDHDASPRDDFLSRTQVEAIFDGSGFLLEESHEHPANSEILLRYYLLLFAA